MTVTDFLALIGLAAIIGAVFSGVTIAVSLMLFAGGITIKDYVVKKIHSLEQYIQP